MFHFYKRRDNLTMAIGLKRGTVRLAAFSRSWKGEFEKEKRRLARRLGGVLIDIQHIGSTSIPGIMAKPIIDIGVAVKSVANLNRFKKLVKPLGYEFIAEASNLKNHLVFTKGAGQFRTHHLHIEKHNSRVWKNDLSFRDYLISHKAAARQYEKLKIALSKKHPKDRRGYTKSKTGFVKNILKRR